ncbi:MAG: cobalt ECF transporter T component CbiQ [Actinomycetota bacterium]
MSAGHTARLYVPGDSPLHRLAPEAKLVAVIAFVIAVAVTPREAVPAFAIDAAIVIVAMAVAGFGPRLVLVRLAVVLPFITFAFLIPFIAGGEQVEVLGVSLSREGLWGTWNIIAKAALGASASLLLAGTTPIPEILSGLGRLRVPPVLVAIVSFMFRYLDVIVDEMRLMRTAMTARGHDPRWLWQAKPIASSAGALFVRSYERGERVHASMLARGFTGTMPQLEQRRATGREWAAAAVVPTIALCAAIGGIILT